MKTIITLVLLLLPATARADWRLLDVDELSMDVFKIADHRQPLYDPKNDNEEWHGGVAVNFDLSLLRYGQRGLYWRNTVQTEGTRSQVRLVSWDFEAGLNIHDKLSIFYHHISKHIQDSVSHNPDKFPLHNHWGARITFYKRR